MVEFASGVGYISAERTPTEEKMRIISRLFIVAMVLAILPAPLWAQSDAERANQLMEDAGKALAHEDYATASELFKELLEYYPQDAGVNFNLGLTLHLQGQNQEAIPYLKKALELDPNHLKAMNALGMVYYYLVDYASARKYLQMYLERNPGDAATYGYLARMSFEDMDYVKSAEYYQQALSYAPNDAGMLYALAVCYQKTGQMTLAAETYLQSSNAGYTSEIPGADPLYHWAYCLYDAGDYQSITSYAVTSATPPLLAKMVGMAYFQLGDYANAINAYKFALNGGLTEVCPQLAQAYSKNEDYSDAAETYRQAIKYDPGNPSPYSNLAYCLNKLERWQEAVDVCQQGLSRTAGDEGLLHYFLGISYFNLGDTENGNTELERFIASADPNRFSSQLEHAKAILVGK
jgi:tetratricopeptide (TPR) repeat protein